MIAPRADAPRGRNTPEELAVQRVPGLLEQELERALDSVETCFVSRRTIEVAERQQSLCLGPPHLLGGEHAGGSGEPFGQTRVEDAAGWIPPGAQRVIRQQVCRSSHAVCFQGVQSATFRERFCRVEQQPGGF